MDSKTTEIFARYFTDGDRELAREVIKFKTEATATREEMRNLSFALGVIVILIPLSMVLHFDEDVRVIAQYLNPAWYGEHGGLPNEPPGATLLCSFFGRMGFVLVLLFLGAASIVHILKTYRINYIYIFNDDPKN